MKKKTDHSTRDLYRERFIRGYDFSKANFPVVLSPPRLLSERGGEGSLVQRFLN